MRCNDYVEWQRNTKVRGNHVKTRLIYATLYEGGFLTKADKQLFNIYDSFKRLDKQYHTALINTYWQCKLPFDYYFDKLSNYYREADPLSKYYQPLWGWYRKLKKQPLYQPSIIDNLTTFNKSQLIKQALQIARSNNVKPPYFKSMPVSEIVKYISTNNSI